jgi:superfamily I DNA/RNA helicase
VKFPFIFVDEFQDTNPLQTMLIKLIGAKSTVINIIGDIAQSIYSFQGAKLSQFAKFTMSGEREVAEYVINGNRRSTANIVSFCNYLRQSDASVFQNSIKPYLNDTAKLAAETKKVHFLIGDSDNIKTLISEIISDGGVVLTRTWAAAFSYIRGITKEQVTSLKRIYNSYSKSPIDIHRDIKEHNFVTWVRAFKFIFGLWNGYQNGSVVDVLRAFHLYKEIEPRKITPKFILQLKKLSEAIFLGLSEGTTCKTTASVVNNFNAKLREYQEIVAILGSDFNIAVFDDADKDDLKSSVLALNWQTSYKLFTEVFSTASKYMTVHQAKGLEWEKVVVSLIPIIGNNSDNITLDVMYRNPCLLDEVRAQEFTRMYYVACSRAKEDLYIHLPEGFDPKIIETALKSYTEKCGQTLEYEII